MGFKPPDILANEIITILQDEREEVAFDLNQLRQEAAQQIHDEREKAKLRCDGLRLPPLVYKIGDLVLAEN